MAAVVGVAADAPVGFAIGDAVAANVVVHDADDVSEADASGALVVVVSAATGICFVVVTAGVVCFYRGPFSFSVVSEVTVADNVVVIVDACVIASLELLLLLFLLLLPLEERRLVPRRLSDGYISD